MKKSAILIFSFIFFLHSLQAAFCQDFSSINSDLEELMNLISDTLTNTQEQQMLLEDLKNSLIESDTLISSYENIISERENSLQDLQIHLNEMSEIYRTQSALSAKYERSSKFWRTFTLIAIPATAVISGGLVWIVSR